MKTLPIEYLRECFDYNQKTGVLRWRARPRHHFKAFKGWRSSHTQVAGKVVAANQSDKYPYPMVMIDKSPFYLHRICFAMIHGYWPVEVDHKDTDTRNIKGKNLRDSTRQQNTFNAKARGTNLAGVKGVYAMMGHYHRKPWKAQVKINGDVYKKGPFATPEEALRAYKQLVAEHHGEFAYIPDISESEMLRRLKLIVLPKSRPNPTIGRVWITDGKINKRLKPTDDIPSGWVLGQAPRRR